MIQYTQISDQAQMSYFCSSLPMELYGLTYIDTAVGPIWKIALVAEWLRVRLRVRMVKGSTLTVGNFLSLENLNVIIRAIN